MIETGIGSILQGPVTSTQQSLPSQDTHYDVALRLASQQATIDALRERCRDLERQLDLDEGQHVLTQDQPDDLREQLQQFRTRVNSAPLVGGAGSVPWGNYVSPPPSARASAVEGDYVAGVRMDPRMCADILVEEMISGDRSDTAYLQKLLRILHIVRSRERNGAW